jgi:hypothetical protein
VVEDPGVAGGVLDEFELAMEPLRRSRIKAPGVYCGVASPDDTAEPSSEVLAVDSVAEPA